MIRLQTTNFLRGEGEKALCGSENKHKLKYDVILKIYIKKNTFRFIDFLSFCFFFRSDAYRWGTYLTF